MMMRGQGAVRRFRLFWVLVAAVLLVAGSRARAGETPDPGGALRVVIFGDSQAQGIAGGLQRVLLNDPRFRILNRTHPGASLIHSPSEWLAPITHFVAHETADIAIVMFGANDRLDLRDDKLGYLHFRTDAWRDAYAAKADELLTALTGAHLKIIWCGNPIARSPTYSEDMNYINDIYEEEVTKFGATFFPLWSVIVDASGQFTAYGKDRNGLNQRLRGDDGIHFTAPGYELIAEKLVALLSETQAAKTQ